MIEIETLLEEILQAEEGSRNLSDRYLLALGWQGIEPNRSGIIAAHWTNPSGQDIPQGLRPDPTRNLQDAIDSLLKGWTWGLASAVRSSPAVSSVGNQDAGKESIQVASAATPQLAMCAANLKTRMASSE